MVGLFAFFLPATLVAGELGDFHRQVAEAYAPYRSAMFYLNSGNADVAYFELQTAAKRWQKVVERFTASVPDTFAEDGRFVDVLNQVQATFEAGSAAIDRDDPEGAIASLVSIRTDLSALRKRNGVRIFSDCVDEMNAAMDRLWAFRDQALDMDQVGQVNAIKREAAIAEFLYQKCYQEAPADLKESDEFERLFDGSLASLPLIFEVLDQGNGDRLVNILRELRSFDQMIWLQFG